MKKIYLFGLAAMISLTGCEDFLDSTNYTGKDSSNFPLNETDVNQMVAAVYEATINEPLKTPADTYFFFANLASDDMYGGGGQNDLQSQAAAHLLYNSESAMQAMWTGRYAGIARANMALANVENIADEELRNQTKGELLFLKAYNYFELAQCFGNIPMLNKAPESVEDAQVSPEQADVKEVFKQIATDLYEATQIMPSYPYDGWSKLAYGKVSRWAAEAFLARVYLYYTGFFNESSMPMAEGAIETGYVVDCLNDVINNSKHDLIEDYRLLWTYSNSETAKDYDYVADLKDAGKSWAKDGKNIEEIFSMNFGYLGDWSGTQLHLTNQFCLYFGIRANDWQNSTKFNKDGEGSVYPFGTGWGSGPVATNLWNDWKEAEPEDMRREASIYDATATINHADNDAQMEETGYFNKKIVAIRSGAGEYFSFAATSAYWGDGTSFGHFQATHPQNLVVIRFADVLLMHSELTRTSDGMNRVRARAGLAATSYTDENLRNERRWELAFEGHRWGDIRRWGIAPQALEKQVGHKIWNAGGIEAKMKAQAGSFSARYNETKGYYRIPNSEVQLSNGAIKQNAGWESSAGYYASWN